MKSIKTLINDIESIDNKELQELLSKIKVRDKRTQKAYLESLSRLTYGLYVLDENNPLCKLLLDEICKTAITSDRNYWTWIDNCLVLNCFIHRHDKKVFDELKEKIYQGKISGSEEMYREVNTRSFKNKILTGVMLDKAKGYLSDALNDDILSTIINRRWIYLYHLMLVYTFKEESTVDVTDFLPKIAKETDEIRNLLNGDPLVIIG